MLNKAYTSSRTQSWFNSKWLPSLSSFALKMLLSRKNFMIDIDIQISDRDSEIIWLDHSQIGFHRHLISLRCTRNLDCDLDPTNWPNFSSTLQRLRTEAHRGNEVWCFFVWKILKKAWFKMRRVFISKPSLIWRRRACALWLHVLSSTARLLNAFLDDRLQKQWSRKAFLRILMAQKSGKSLFVRPVKLTLSLPTSTQAVRRILHHTYRGPLRTLV